MCGPSTSPSGCIDFGFHPPTIYFPLIVDEGMLIEPTETESIETLDAFADTLIAIAAEARSDPEMRPDGATHRPGAPARRGHGRPPAEPPMAADGRRGDPLSGLRSGSRRARVGPVPRAKRTIVRVMVDSPSGAVDSTPSAPT